MNTGIEEISERESVARQVFRYALPAVMGLVFYGVQNVIDGLIVGRFIGVDALAGVNMVMPLYVVIGVVAIMTGVGNQALIGICMGRKEYARAQDALRSGAVFILIALTAFALLALAFPEKLTSLLGVNERLMPNAIGYLKGLMLLAPFIGYMFYSDCMIKISGHPRFAFVIMFVTVVVNTLLNLFFVLVCGMGTFGVGLATGVAFTLGAIPGSLILFNRKNVINLRKGRFSFKLLGEMLYNGSSEGLSEFSAGISLILFNYALMKHVGPDGVAAFSVINYLFYLGLTVFIGVSDGIVPIVSYNYGAGHFDRLRQVLRLTLKVNLVIGILIFLFVMFFSESIVSLFVDDPAVVRIAVEGASIYVFAFLLNGVNILFSGMFTAMANAGYSLVISSLRGLVLVISGLLIFPTFYGVDGIWMTVPIAEVITCFVVCLLYRRARKRIFIKV